MDLNSATKNNYKTMTTATYKNIDISFELSGWYSAFVPGYGYVKADSVRGVKRLIDSKTKKK